MEFERSIEKSIHTKPVGSKICVEIYFQIPFFARFVPLPREAISDILKLQQNILRLRKYFFNRLQTKIDMVNRGALS